MLNQMRQKFLHCTLLPTVPCCRPALLHMEQYGKFTKTEPPLSLTHDSPLPIFPSSPWLSPLPSVTKQKGKKEASIQPSIYCFSLFPKQLVQLRVLYNLSKADKYMDDSSRPPNLIYSALIRSKMI